MYTGMSSAAASRIMDPVHSIDARITVLSPGIGQLTLPLSDGSVTFDSTAQVRRTASITVDPKYWPKGPLDLLAPFGSKGWIEYGIGLPSGDVEWVPLGTYYLDQDQRQRPSTTNGGMTVTMSDRSSRIQEDRATAPIQTLAGATAVHEIARLIQLTDPSIIVTDLTGSGIVAPQIVISQDKWADGVEVLATSIAAEVITDLNDQFVIRPTPSVADSPVWQIARSLRPRAENITSIQDTLDRANVYNRFVISAQRTDGSTAFTVIVEDDNPSSPTYINGPFGKRTRYYSSASFTNTAQATAAGQAMLAKSTAFAVVPVFNIITNPALDAGDVLMYSDGDDSIPYPILLSKVTTPFNLSSLQELDIVTYTLPDEGS